MTKNKRIAQDSANQTVIADTIMNMYKIEYRHNSGFGVGFVRWITTDYLKEVLKWEYRVIRRECDKLVKRGLIERKWSPGNYVKYSLKEYAGYEIAHDYFIEVKPQIT